MTKLVLKDCGRHSGLTPGPCAKCALPLPAPGLLQAGGTPLVALIGEKASPAQQRWFDELRRPRSP